MIDKIRQLYNVFNAHDFEEFFSQRISNRKTIEMSEKETQEKNESTETKGGVSLTSIIVMILALIICCSNVLLLEKIVKEAPNCTAFVTFSAYFTIVAQTIVFRPGLLINYTIPLHNYVIITTLFYTTNLCNNMALSYSVDMPTLLIFRSGSLLANMVVSIIAFKRSYPVSKYVSVLMVTVGIIVATLASADLKKNSSDEATFSVWLIGITMLTYALFGSAVMGVFQEKLFAQFGKKSDEVLFFSHLLGLPAFIFNYRDLAQTIVDFNHSEPVSILGFNIPFLWCCITANVALQTLGIKCIFFLLSEWSSLAVTMVTTLRKFISLLLSIFLFKNPFTLPHWVGTTLVFTGSALFSGIIPLPGSKVKTQ